MMCQSLMANPLRHHRCLLFFIDFVFNLVRGNFNIALYSRRLACDVKAHAAHPLHVTSKHRQPSPRMWGQSSSFSLGQNNRFLLSRELQSILSPPPRVLSPGFYPPCFVPRVLSSGYYPRDGRAWAAEGLQLKMRARKKMPENGKCECGACAGVGYNGLRQVVLTGIQFSTNAFVYFPSGWPWTRIFHTVQPKWP